MSRARHITHFMKRGAKKDSEKIEKMEKKLQEALSVFHLGSSLTTAVDVASLREDVDTEKLVEDANKRFTDIAVPIIKMQSILNTLPCVAGASWDSNPKSMCLPGTRVELLDDIWSWIQSENCESGGRIFWLTSVAGAGKTAIAHTIAERCNQRGILGASFFFNAAAGRDNPNQLFSTIARGLAKCSRELASRISFAVEDDPTLLTAPLFRQFTGLIKGPTMHYTSLNPLVIIIDAFDEVPSPTALRILRDGGLQLPACFRIVITSRPLQSIRQELVNRLHIVSHTLDIRSQSSMEDIELYIRQELLEVAELRQLPAEWPDEDLTVQFIANSQGLFVWAHTIIQYLHKCINPTQKLRLLVERSPKHSQSAEGKIDELYSDILNTCPWDDDEFAEGYQMFMGAIMAAKLPLSISALQALHGDSTIDVAEILQPMGSLLSGLSDPHRPVEILHLSLQEFLTSRSKNQPEFKTFYLDLKHHRQRMGSLCLRILNDELDGDVPGAWFSLAEEPGVPVISEAEDSMSEALRYASRFLVDHLLDCDVEDFAKHDLETFLVQDLLLWIQFVTVRWRLPDLGAMMSWLNKASGATALCEATYSSARLAEAFETISDRLAYMNRIDEALAAAEEAATLYRALSAVDPVLSTPALANSLLRFSNMLRDVGQREKALASIEESVELRRQLVADQSAAFTHGLSQSLTSLSICLSELGRREEALEAIEESVKLDRELVADRPAAFTHDLSISLINLSEGLSDLGRREEALEAIEESVKLVRELVADRPAAFTHNLSISLTCLSNRLSDLGRREEALETIEESVKLDRELVADRPAAFTHNLSISLATLSNQLSDLGRREEALEAIETSVKLDRGLVADRPAAFTHNLSISLNILSNLLSDLGRREEALEVIEESVKLDRELVADRPAAFTRDLSQSLNDLSNLLFDQGRKEEAFIAAKDSVQLRRELHAVRPKVFESDLAESLCTLSRQLSDLGQSGEAVLAAQEAVELYTPLATKYPTVFQEKLDNAMQYLSKPLEEDGCSAKLPSSEDFHKTVDSEGAGLTTDHKAVDVVCVA